MADGSEILERLTRIEVLLDQKVSQLENRVGKLEGNQTWLTRLILGAIIGAILGVVIL